MNGKNRDQKAKNPVLFSQCAGFQSDIFLFYLSDRIFAQLKVFIF